MSAAAAHTPTKGQLAAGKQLNTDATTTPEQENPPPIMTHTQRPHMLLIFPSHNVRLAIVLSWLHCVCLCVCGMFYFFFFKCTTVQTQTAEPEAVCQESHLSLRYARRASERPSRRSVQISVKHSIDAPDLTRRT